MATYFADNVFFVALLSSRDRLHEAAVTLESRLLSEGALFVTTDLVLAECLAAFSKTNPYLRASAVRFVRSVYQVQHFRVVPLTRDLLAKGLDLYEARPDKRYSLADTVSMVICRERGITEVLTADHDFGHEGFRILLRL